MNSQTITPVTRANTPQFGQSPEKGSKNTSKKSATGGARAATLQSGGEKKPDIQLKQQAAPEAVETIFRFAAPNANEVMLVGEFTDWGSAPVRMIKGNRGIWRAMVPLLRGRYSYRVIADGQWQNDPDCVELVPNGFGSFNNSIEVK